MKRNKGITLIALVVTIVVLLILAGITINYVMGDNSIFQKAVTAKEKTQTAQIREKIEFVVMDWWMGKQTNPDIDIDDFWDKLIDAGIIENEGDYSGPEKDGDNDVYIVDTKDGGVVEIIVTPDGNIEIGEVVLGDKLPPKVGSIKVVTKSSESISVQVTVRRLEEGKLSYYYKTVDETTYHELAGKQNTTDLTADFTNLEPNKIYNIRVVVKNSKGTSETVISELTGELRYGTIQQVGTTTWSAGKASIQVVLKDAEARFKLEYQVGSISGTWLPCNGTIGNLEHNDTVYVRSSDGVNHGEDSATIEIRDGGAPTVTVTKGTTTTNSVAVTVSSSDAEWGMPTSPSYSYFIKKSSESSYGTAKYTGTNTSYTFTGLTQNTNYDVKVTTKDKAQNEGSGTATGIGTGTIGGAGSDLATGSIVASSPTWSAGKASITLTTTTDLQIQWQKGGIDGEWTTVPAGTKSVTVSGLDHGDNVYARLYDGTNAGDSAYVRIADGIAPTVTVTKGATTTNSVTVSASSSDGQWGMPTSPSYSYFIKKSSESSYGTAKYTGTNTSYTFTGLTQNTNYDVKVTTKDKAQNEGSGTATGIGTGTVGGAGSDLATGNIVASAPTWSGGKASITLSTTSGLQIQWQKNGIDANKWTTGTSVTELSHGDNVYARLWDGTNAGDSAYVRIADGTAPSNATITLGATSANTGATVTATVTHNDAQSGVKIASCKWVYNTTSTKIGTTASSYTGGTFTSNGQQINLSASTPGTYYLHVLTTDNANNVWETVSSAVTVKQLATGISVSPTTANVDVGKTTQLSATVTPSSASNKGVTWSSGDATIATVSSTGLVTGKKAGTVTITAKTSDGSNKSATCSVTVKTAEPTVGDSSTGSHTAGTVNYTWDQMNKIAIAIANASGVNSSTTEVTANVDGTNLKLGVGDIATVQYSGTNVRVRVLGFKHDDLVNKAVYGGNHTKASISFEFLDFMTGTTYKSMNGSSTNSGGWANTQMRKDLNGYTTNAAAQSGAIGGLGANLNNKSYIKQVKKKYIATYNSASSVTTCNDYLWLLAASEVVSSGYQSGYYAYAITSEGPQYKYYQGVTDAWNSSSTGRQKRPSASGSAAWWWLRSPRYSSDTSFCRVLADGIVTGSNYASADGGVAPGFCI